MLFYDKHGKVIVKTEEELQEIAPSKLYEEQLFVLCRSDIFQSLVHYFISVFIRRNNPALEGKAREMVQNWASKFPDWRTNYLV